jgi:acetoin utilization protein AcuB
MIAEELLSENIIPLKRSDLCEAALSFMADARATEMPVVEQGKLVGYLHVGKAEKAKSKTVGMAMENSNLFLPHDTHLFDVARIMNEAKVTTIAVCDVSQVYKGAISLTDLLKAYTNNTAVVQAGAIVTLELFPRDYSLTEISRITEQNDCKITDLFIRNLEDHKMELSLKFNTTEIKTVLHALERFGYIIKAVHQLSDQKGNLDNRLDWLIKYINT